MASAFSWSHLPLSSGVSMPAMRTEVLSPNSGGLLVGDEVKIKLEIEVIKEKGGSGEKG